MSDDLPGMWDKSDLSGGATDNMNPPEEATPTHDATGHLIGEPIKSAHALLLNRLTEMQRSPYYATAKEELALAEQTVVGQESELAQLQRQVAELESKNAGSLANNLCQDCRDKQVGQPCLGCTIQKLQRQVAEGQIIIAELVACKDLKEAAITPYDPPENWGELLDEYQQRKPLAWDVARKYLVGNSDALTSALVAERERCAQIADRISNALDDPPAVVAAAIRALGNTDGGSDG